MQSHTEQDAQANRGPAGRPGPGSGKSDGTTYGKSSGGGKGRKPNDDGRIRPKDPRQFR
jgi:hypothetical protein